VLDDVGEVAGMEAVTVVHGKVGGPLRNTATFYASWPGLSRPSTAPPDQANGKIRLWPRCN
jgi:hypothetical protein